MSNDCLKFLEILGVDESATSEEITAAYKKLALKWHPDRRLNDQENATKKFVEINDAYRALLSERRRGRSSSATSTSRSRSRSSSRTPSVNDSCPDFDTRSASSCTSFESDEMPEDDDCRQDEYMRNPSMNKCDGFSDNDYASDWTHVNPPSSDNHSGKSTESAPRKKTSTPKVNPFKAKFRNPFRHGSQRPPQPTCSSTGTCDTGQNQYRYEPKRVPTISLRKQTSSKEWTYSLQLTLEELYHGKHCRFRLDRYSQAGTRRRIVINIDVPPGCTPGKRIVCAGAGHECKDGTYQDIVFVVEEESHDMFYRVADDLVMEVTLPWDDNLLKEPGTVRFRGVDGDSHTIKIDCRKEKSLNGCNIVFGAGMPIGRDPSRRGDLFVRWQIEPPCVPKWQAFKKMFHMR